MANGWFSGTAVGPDGTSLEKGVVGWSSGTVVQGVGPDGTSSEKGAVGGVSSSLQALAFLQRLFVLDGCGTVPSLVWGVSPTSS